MAISTPSFNLLADVWLFERVPADGAADITLQVAQLYHYSKSASDLDVTGAAFIYSLLCIWRLPSSFAIANTANNIAGCVIGYLDSTGTVRYYKCHYWDLIHPGFSNEYAMLLCSQCTDTGASPDTGR